MHAHCLLGDVFGATGCDCSQTLEAALERIATEGRGALIYLHQTSRGFSAEKVGDQSFLTFHRERRLPTLPDSERKTQREIGLGAQILSDLNLKRIRSAHQSPASSGGARRLRYRDCGAGSGQFWRAQAVERGLHPFPKIAVSLT